MPNILKPFLCILGNTLLALLLLFVWGEPLVVVLIVSFVGFALSFYVAPNFGVPAEDEKGAGPNTLFSWFAIFGVIIIPGLFICSETSKYNFGGKAAENVPVSQVENYADYDLFYFDQIRPLLEYKERLCKTTKSGKTGFSTICYNVFPVTDDKDSGVYRVWAVYTDYDDKEDFQNAKSGVRVNSDHDKYSETVQNAVRKFGIKSAENPVFITLTIDAHEKIKQTIQTLILAFVICIVIGTTAKGYLMYLSKK